MDGKSDIDIGSSIRKGISHIHSVKKKRIREAALFLDKTDRQTEHYYVPLYVFLKQRPPTTTVFVLLWNQWPFRVPVLLPSSV